MPRFTTAFAVLVLLTVPAAAAAAPPANDAFAAAEVLTLGSAVNGSLLEATGEAGERLGGDAPGDLTARRCASPTSAPNCTATVWYRITPPSGTFTVETCDWGTAVDTTLRLQTGTTVAGTQVAFDDQSCAGGGDSGAGSQVTATADGTTTYRVQVSSYRRETGRVWVRAYAGAPQPPPAFDTDIRRLRSFPYLERLSSPSLPNPGLGTGDGPRQTASFSFRAVSAPGAAFECALDGGAFAACISPVSYDSVQSGTHDFAVRAVVGGVPDPTPARQTVTIDRTAPDTSLVSGALGDTSADLAYVAGASEPVDVHDAGMCAFDEAPATPCSLYVTQSAVGTCLGPHAFTAVASDSAGNVDPTPLVVRPNRTSGLACVAPTIGAPTGGGQQYGGFAQASVDAGGRVGTLRMDIGTSSAYGRTIEREFGPGSGTASVGVSYLQPDTTYHYRLRIETSLGTSATPDQTFTTTAAPSTPQTVTTGDPVAVGAHALRVPVSFTTQASSVDVGVFIAEGTSVGPDATKLFTEGATAVDGTRDVDAIDLEPNTTYTVRAWLETGGRSILGPPRTVRTGALPAPGGPPAAPAPTPGLPAPLPLPAPGPKPSTQPAAPFRLTAKNVTVARTISRRASSVSVALKGLPARTKVTVVLTAGATRLGTQTGTATSGRVTLKVKLGRKARRAIRRKTLKKLKLVVTTTPPGTAASKVTIERKLA